MAKCIKCDKQALALMEWCHECALGAHPDEVLAGDLVFRAVQGLLHPIRFASGMDPTMSKPVLLCALGLLAAFFMPWVQLGGVGMSGYNLGQLGSYGNYAWVIPILVGATILATFARANNRVIGAIAGIVPLAAVLYGLLRVNEEGGRDAANGVLEIAGRILSIGAWLTIIFSIAIIISAFVKTPAVISQGQKPEAERRARNVGEELARLADLHAKGVLDADEFKAAKRKLLG